MLTTSPFTTIVASSAPADSAVPPDRGTDMERLALALLKCAERFEVEAGLVMQVTPPFSVEELAALAGIGDYSAGLMLEYLLEGGFITRHRRRFVLHMPQALYRLALGAKPV